MCNALAVVFILTVTHLGWVIYLQIGLAQTQQTVQITIAAYLPRTNSNMIID